MADNPLIDPNIDTANVNLFDAEIRHQISIRRFTAGEVKRILADLEAADRDLVLKLRRRLRKFAGKPTDFTTERFKTLRRDIRKARRELIKAIRRKTRKNLLELAKMEVDFEKRIFEAAIPVEISFGTVQLSKLRPLVVQKPFNGRTLGEWFNSLARSDQSRLLQQLQIGLTQQETIDDMVRRVAGTRANGFRDGVLATTRREAATVVRTAVNHVSNQAREEFWSGNEDIIQALRWTSLLDGRTTAICRSRDGKLAPIGNKPLPEGSPALSPPNARPPALPACRSTMVAALDTDGIASKLPERTFVRETRTRRRREIDFRRMARERDVPIQDVRKAWARRNIGQLPGTVTYNDFLKRQPAKFQRDVLGKTKGDLFRRGKLSVDDFVDRQGTELTLQRLARTQPEAFVRAGLDPSEF